MDTDRFVAAFRYAAELHRSQVRKGTDIPYISHLMAVAATVLEQGGDEDQGGRRLAPRRHRDHPDGGRTRDTIRERFGDRVVTLVEACTDADTHPKPPWRERKERYLEHLAQAPPEARLIALADKLHNARAILTDHRAVGERVWERFNAPKDATLWYYRALADAFARLEPGRLAAEFERVVADLEEEARQTQS